MTFNGYYRRPVGRDSQRLRGR